MFRAVFILSCSLWTFVYALNVMPVGDSLTIGCGSVCGGFDCRIGKLGSGSGYSNFLLSLTILHSHACTRLDTSSPCAPCSGGYREPLWHMLNYSYPGAFNFVGSRNNGPEWMGNDTSHEGYIGKDNTLNKNQGAFDFNMTILRRLLRVTANGEGCFVGKIRA